MCICVVAYQSCSSLPLILLANRDEFYSRTTLPVHDWDGDSKIVAGKDLAHGGTWLGYNKNQQWISITNFRTTDIKKNTRSRGLILTDYLEHQQSAKQFCEELLQQCDRYNPFNLFVGDENDLYYFTSNEQQFIQLTPGIYCVSNAGLNTPWPKVVRLTQNFSALLEQPFYDAQLWSLLQDHTQANDNELPNTGISKELEKMLSSIFIKTKDYGTLSSYILAKSPLGTLNLQEKCYQHE